MLQDGFYFQKGPVYVGTEQHVPDAGCSKSWASCLPPISRPLTLALGERAWWGVAPAAVGAPVLRGARGTCTPPCPGALGAGFALPLSVLLLTNSLRAPPKIGVVLVAGLMGLVGKTGLAPEPSGVLLGVKGVGPAGLVGTLNCDCMGGMQKGAGFQKGTVGGCATPSLWVNASSGDPNPASAKKLVTCVGLLGNGEW